MTIFENLMSKNMNELVEWLDKNGAYTDAPWVKWFDKNHCKKCKAVKASFIVDQYGDYWDGEHEFSWCELNGKCIYFQDMKKVPNRKEVIRLWLESEVK